ncbi:TonB-dependent receptor [Flavobacterium piscis]|uniref:TonB-linked SusC/RagA family outer membrane protein n=1 Tax=Flavobacterium piscis TaxID=1114874 RepID=A0ABU1Y509_9FLAO|nr:TonB-dependent receptor [Flavobacterium piscis]MDR7208750.1 TonB-linked SusC/RagA family outer membrane protein [Flavobacterium piscis]
MNFKDLLNKRANYCFAFVFLLCLLSSNQVSAQDTTLEGVVKDASGLTLPGVNVLEKGTKNGVSTDFDGKYKLKLSNSKAIVEFSFIGFTTQSVPVAGKKTINVVLAEEANALNEVVVIGYGTVKKSDLTGAVSTISGNDLKKVPVANVAEALTGRIAGVQVTSSEGSPDADIRIRVRGGGSLTQDASPLIIVDGFPVNSMNDISSSDIDSMTVLKDASSTAIYGSRGANGVILITTKSGKDGKMSVSFNMFYGMKTMAKQIDVLSPEDYTKWQYEYALLSQTGTKVASNPTSYTKYFGNWQDQDIYKGLKGDNWQKQIFGRTGEVQSRDLGIRGGNDKLNYNFNYAHFDEKAIMIGSNYKRNNLSMALKSKITDRIDAGFTIRYSDTEINGGGVNEQNEKSSSDSRMRTIVGYSPVPVPGLTSATDDTNEGDLMVNPFASVYDNDRQQFRKNFNMLGSFGWELIDNLKLKVDLGLDNFNNLDYRFYGLTTYYIDNAPLGVNQGMPAMIMTDTKDRRFRNANTLNYDFKKVMGEDHHLSALLGQESITYNSNSVTTTIHGYPTFFDFNKAKTLTTQGKPQAVDNYYNPDDKLLSFFGRVNYDYKNRYLLTGTFRADGSSKFLKQNRWGYFPAVAAGWKMSEESFLKNVSWLDLLKVRASYGEAGNNNIPVGQQVQTFQSTTTTWINGVESIWAPSKIMPNPDLKWETTVTRNFGLDFGFFKNRINGTLDYYNNTTSDLLINFLTGGTGYDSQFRNMGETQNKGFEATINVIALEREKYGLSFSFNMGINKNRINSLGIMDDFGTNTGWASTQIGADYLVAVGSSLGTMYGYQNDGRYEVSDFDWDGTKYTLKSGVADATGIVSSSAIQPGYMKLKDITGDGKVDANDQTVIGNVNPKSTGGFVINGNAYGFDLMAAFNWSVGNDVYNADKIEFSTAIPGAGQYKNLNTIMADGSRWTNLDPDSGQLVTDPAALTALNANTTMWSPYMRSAVFSDWAVEDASFLRLNTLTLGYTTPESFTSKMGISKLRFYLTANNVFVWTNYSGSDPEVSTRRKNPLTPGVDSSPYPRSRQMVFGMNLNF